MAKPGRPRGPKSPTFNHPTGRDRIPHAAPHEPAPDFSLLSDEAKEEITKEAKAKVEATAKDRAMEAYLAKEVERLERELVPDAHEEEKEITLDLAIYADRLIINGRHYMHGRTYTVKQSLYNAMKDIQSQTWKHYAATHKDPNEAAMKAQQAIAKGGHSYATLNSQTGQVSKF